MKILQVHNYYQRRGGEDETAEQEVDLLRENGHTVEFYTRHNDEIKDYSLLKQAGLLYQTAWSRRTYKEVSGLLKSFRPELVHVQNFFPLISPSVFYACRDNNTPVCLTLHDYRLACPIGWFYRDDSICTECMDHSPLRAVRHKCYHNSALKSLPISLMLMIHRFLGTWTRHVTAYSAMTETSRKIFIEAGLPAEKIFLRPHFLSEDPGPGTDHREGAVFTGRLSREKGVLTMLSAWKDIPIQLTILGDGPMRSEMEKFVERNNMTQVTFKGFIAPSKVFDHLKKAEMLIMPSQWQETFGRTVMEAFATATPVIASRLGALKDIISPEKTGMLFTHDKPDELKQAVLKLQSNKKQARTMGQAARKKFEASFSEQAGIDGLIDFYKNVIKHKQ